MVGRRSASQHRRRLKRLRAHLHQIEVSARAAISETRRLRAGFKRTRSGSLTGAATAFLFLLLLGLFFLIWLHSLSGGLLP